jgi:hypothetical protein
MKTIFNKIILKIKHELMKTLMRINKKPRATNRIVDVHPSQSLFSSTSKSNSLPLSQDGTVAHYVKADAENQDTVSLLIKIPQSQ